LFIIIKYNTFEKPKTKQMKTKVKKCLITGKHRYASEASATRAVNKHSDLERYYKCNHCDGYHTTSRQAKVMVESKGFPKHKKKELLKKINTPQKTIDNLEVSINRLKDKVNTEKRINRKYNDFINSNFLVKFLYKKWIKKQSK